MIIVRLSNAFNYVNSMIHQIVLYDCCVTALEDLTLWSVRWNQAISYSNFDVFFIGHFASLTFFPNKGKNCIV